MDDEDDFNFEERFAEQIKEEQRLNAFIFGESG